MRERGVPRDQRLIGVEVAGARPGQNVGLGALGVSLGVVQWATSGACLPVPPDW
jgi:hypothetical protein